MGTVKNGCAAENQNNRVPRVRISRYVIEVQSQESTLHDCLSFTAAAFKRTADKAANVLDFIALAF